MAGKLQNKHIPKKDILCKLNNEKLPSWHLPLLSGLTHNEASCQS